MNCRLYRIIILCVLLSLLLTAPVAAASVPQVARLSLVTENAWDLDQDTIDMLDDMVADALHMPFGGLMGWVQDVDEHDLFAAYNAAVEMKRTTRDTPDYPAIVRMVADVTDADLAVLPILTYYDEEIYHGWDFSADDYLVSRASVRLLVYDRQKDELVDRRITRTFRDEYAVRGRAHELARDAMRAVLGEVRLKERVRDLREAARSGRYPY